MPVPAAAAASSRKEWLVTAGLIALGLIPALFGVARLAELARGAEITASNARFFAQPLPIVLHVLVVIPYCIVGAFQFAPGFRRRNRAWHRAAGRVLAPLGLVAALTGLWMSHFYEWPAGDGYALYLIRLAVGVAMAAAIVLAVLAVRRRDYTAHGEWMLRAYALGLGAGTQVLTHLPWFILFGQPGELARTVLMGGAWAINAGIAEWVILRGRRRPAVGPVRQRAAA